jgi:hypothetical protein
LHACKIKRRKGRFRITRAHVDKTVQAKLKKSRENDQKLISLIKFWKFRVFHCKKHRKMNDYIERIKNEAENVFKNMFPQKALELDSIIKVGVKNDPFFSVLSQHTHQKLSITRL